MSTRTKPPIRSVPAFVEDVLTAGLNDDDTPFAIMPPDFLRLPHSSREELAALLDDAACALRHGLVH